MTAKEVGQRLREEQQEWAKTLQKNYEEEQKRKKKEKEKMRKRLEEVLNQEKGGGFPLKKDTREENDENDEGFPLVRFRR
jgi:prolyl oligopeptidase PreP (S9A serine peptidase family)